MVELQSGAEVRSGNINLAPHLGLLIMPNDWNYVNDVLKEAIPDSDHLVSPRSGNYHYKFERCQEYVMFNWEFDFTFDTEVLPDITLTTTEGDGQYFYDKETGVLLRSTSWRSDTLRNDTIVDYAARINNLNFGGVSSCDHFHDVSFLPFWSLLVLIPIRRFFVYSS
jgi:hypothetical protein